MEWKDITVWLWGFLVPAGVWIWNKQDKRMDAIEQALPKKAEKSDVNKDLEDRRQDIKELYRLNLDLRTDMMDGFGQVKDLVYQGHTEILRELSKKVEK